MFCYNSSHERRPAASCGRDPYMIIIKLCQKQLYDMGLFKEVELIIPPKKKTK